VDAKLCFDHEELQKALDIGRKEKLQRDQKCITKWLDRPSIVANNDANDFQRISTVLEIAPEFLEGGESRQISPEPTLPHDRPANRNLALYPGKPSTRHQACKLREKTQMILYFLLLHKFRYTKHVF
jgi:hypothetical protein